mmetsp:Transcript_10061/g.14193  ORF Transcript_10061/g.14193 Transcript_10061/m.14193 type:complete len:397 (-) Transcript_10061:188-1378(-)
MQTPTENRIAEEMDIAEEVGADTSQPPADMSVDSEQEAAELLPERTESQHVKALKVEKVLSDVDGLQQPVHDLARTTSAMCGNMSQLDDADIQTLQNELESAHQAHKEARNFGEDLVERMLALDSLSNLATKDRSTRKAALESIEGLLEQVDAAKGRLQTLKRDIEQRIEKETENEMAKEGEQELGAHRNAAPGKQQPATQQTPASQVRREQLLEHIPPLPPTEAWRSLRLPVQFRASEEQARYVIRASIPGVDATSLVAKLDEDADSLTIQGHRAPNEDELQLMQERLCSMLEEVIHKNPSRLSQVVQSLSPATYLKLGQGKYGSFSHTIAVPADVNADRITLSCADDVLLARLPKRGSMSYSARNVPVHRHRYHPDPYRNFSMPGVFGNFGRVF